MRAKVMAGLLGLGIMATSGCSVAGKWDLSTVDPTAAQRDVQYHHLTLQEDGTFFAEAKEETGVRTTSGTYSYKNGVLDLKEHDGERHTYDANLKTANELDLENFWEGQKVKMKYERRN